MTSVTCHGMLWHLHEPTWHDMGDMSRWLITALGLEPEPNWGPKWWQAYHNTQSEVYHGSYTILGSNWINILNPIQSSPLSYSTTSAHTHTHSWRGFLRSWDAGQRCCPPAPAWSWAWAWSWWSEGCCLDHPAHPPEKVRPVRRISDRVIGRYSKLTSMLSFRGGTEIYDDYIIFWLSSYSWPPPLYILASD